ncbi:hypothetical protein EON81_03420 [bacterium]|nr:MAG: hypothetical protein EON81_03420 [bacterium]
MRRPYLLSLVVLALLPTALFAQKKGEDAKYRLKPNVSKVSPTGYYIPIDLEDAYRELDKMLSKEYREEIQAGKDDPETTYVLGRWIRNNWGLWRGDRLAKWFQGRRVVHPEDMSGILLATYRNRLNGKLSGFQAMAREAQESLAAAAKRGEAEDAQEKRSIEMIGAMMKPLEVVPTKPLIVRFPKQQGQGLRLRYAAPFRGGVLVTTKEDVKGRPDAIPKPYFLDLGSKQLRPVIVSEFDRVEECVVIGDLAFIHGRKDGEDRLLELDGENRKLIALPLKGNLRLGIDRNTESLIVVGKGFLGRWENGAWTEISMGSIEPPPTFLPPQLIERRLYFRNEGENESDAGLSWIDLDSPEKLVSFVRHVGVVTSMGPRWENVWSYAPSPGGKLWISTGTSLNSQSLLLKDREGRYRVAMYNDGVTFTEEFFTVTDSSEDTPEHALSVVGLESRSDGIRAVGAHGLFSIDERRLVQLLRFRDTPKAWYPSILLTLEGGRTLLGGAWGGAFLLENGLKGSLKATQIDARVGLPISF